MQVICMYVHDVHDGYTNDADHTYIESQAQGFCMLFHNNIIIVVVNLAPFYFGQMLATEHIVYCLYFNKM